MTRAPIDPATLRRLVELAQDPESPGVKALAARLGLSECSARQALRAAGVQTGRQGTAERGTRLRALWAQGLPLAECARQLGVGVDAASRLAHALRLPRRDLRGVMPASP